MKERSEQELVRIKKLAELRTGGFNFPNDIKVTASTKDLLSLEVVEASKSQRYSIAGRIVQMRLMGKAAFIHILDANGKIQVYVKKDDIGEEIYNQFKTYDIGDIVYVSGYVFITKTGEQSLHAESIKLLTKSLIPLPEKWHGLTDIESRYRYRYVDLIANPEVREVFKTRAKIISFIRRFLDQRDYVEVETPVLHYVAGGASAKPFKTFYNSLGTEEYLRIALELPLKKLIVGGLERVYEIGRVFRNEGLLRKHNPEFTMIEFYQAYATYHDLMDLTEELISSLVQELTGGSILKFQDREINFTRPWKRYTMQDAIHEIGGVERTKDLSDLSVLKSLAQDLKLDLTDASDWGYCLVDLFEHLVEAKLVDPVFITKHPFSTSPLARKNSENPNLTDRFELIVSGMELANAFSELNDAEDQRARFLKQAERKAAGDEEAHDVDEDFLTALEYGLPPTAGQGIGIDRLVMLLTDSASIKDVLLFPQLKPLEHD